MIYRLCILLVCVYTISSCSEGDEIEISVDFNATLENCSNANNRTFVFYKIDTASNRSLSVNFTDSSFDSTPELADISITDPTIITLNTTSNLLIYREFDAAIIGSTYFCNSIPPSDIKVTQELTSTNGTIEISYTLIADTMYQRTITLKNITLSGSGFSIRREIFILGSDIIEVN